ncbi:MFS transporter [Micromonospora sp. NPDC049559]|uniref:MFS transporter n=1 Tax=Micromonospora sp. NPDC049559 TaxID=3155923 RepID=UPI00342E48BA
MPEGLDGRRRSLLAVVCAVAVANIYAAQPVLADAGADLGLPAADLGWLVAAGQVGYLLGLVALVPLGDVLDRRRLIAAQLALTAVGTGVVAASSTAPFALIGLGVAGLFSVVVQIAVAYAAALSPARERGRNIGVVTSGVVIGILGARTVAGFLADLAGWRAVYVALATASLLLAVLVLAALPPERREQDRAGYRRRVAAMGRLVAGDRAFRGRALIAFFLFASFGTLWSGIALPLGAAPWHLTPTQIGLFGFAGLAGALAAAGAGRWADRGYASPVAGWSLLALIVSWALSGQAGRSLWLLGAGIILLDFAVQAVHVSNQHLLTSSHPERSSATIGAYMVFYSLGSALGAISTAWAYAAEGWPGAALLGAGYAAAGLVVWAAHRRHPVPSPTNAAPSAISAAPSAISAAVTDAAQGRRTPPPTDAVPGRLGRNLRL